MKSHPGRLLVVLLMLHLAPGCAHTKEGEDRTPRRVREMGGERDQPRVELAPTMSSVRTIQLYRGRDESLLPILRLESSETLTLEFDLIESAGRPLSAYFYHADRRWNRDLSPAEYLETFQHGDLLDYSMSAGTEVDYVHYSFTFPRDDISFVLSGNYVLRVTEQGSEEEVLFERPFFVTEQATSVELGFDTYTAAGQGFRTVTPVALFAPPSGIEANVFDYSVCFIQNGQLSRTRCSTDPSLMEQPSLRFYLQPSSAFNPTSSDYFLDLSNLSVGGRTERIDRSVTPFVVILEPDYARFGGSGIDPLLNGQAVVRRAVRSVSDPAASAEYVKVVFSLVPPNERRVRGEIYIVGSFNSWGPDAESRLRFVPERGRYEGEVLVKQGYYEYRYHATDAGVRKALDRGVPRSQNLYTAFVYYSDVRINSDRLLAVNAQERPY